VSSLENIALICGTAGLGTSIVFAVWGLLSARTVFMETNSGKHIAASVSGSQIPSLISFSLLVVSLAFITISLIARAVATGHGPFSSMYEFAVAFSWGVMTMGLFFRWRYKIPVVSVISMAVALALLLFARTISSQAAPLVPALQQSLLLTTHVASAVISYGAFTIGFGTSILYLIKNNSEEDADALDQISYRSVMIGFPFMTLVIVLGALWADIAWGRYWSWDPKETASLVTWLLYASYLHARVLRGWRGRRAAILLIIGFCAVLATFLGNYVFSGLHSYR
jgi:ABC-type transport system involved in cytochrome c biogenesis permease subunit